MNEVSEVFAGGEVRWSTQGPLPALQRQQQRIPCRQAQSPQTQWLTGLGSRWLGVMGDSFVLSLQTLFDLTPNSGGHLMRSPGKFVSEMKDQGQHDQSWVRPGHEAPLEGRQSSGAQRRERLEVWQSPPCPPPISLPQV